MFVPVAITTMVKYIPLSPLLRLPRCRGSTMVPRNGITVVPITMQLSALCSPSYSSHTVLFDLVDLFVVDRKLFVKSQMFVNNANIYKHVVV